MERTNDIAVFEQGLARIEAVAEPERSVPSIRFNVRLRGVNLGSFYCTRNEIWGLLRHGLPILSGSHALRAEWGDIQYICLGPPQRRASQPLRVNLDRQEIEMLATALLIPASREMVAA